MEVYTIVRAHGLRSHLLSRQDYEALLKGARKLWNYPDYTGISEKDSLEQKLEKVYGVYTSRMNFLARLSPEMSSFILSLLDRLEVENIKIHLKYLMGFQRPVAYYPYGRYLGPAKLASLRTESSLWKALSGSPFELPEGFSFKTTLPAEREALLDVLYLTHLLKEARSLKLSKSAISDLEKLVSYEYTVNYVVWEKTLGGNLLSEIVKALQLPLRLSEHLLDDLRPKPVSDVLIAGRRKVYSQALIEVKRHPVDAVYVYAFNVLAYTEAQNLERILLGWELGLPEEIINNYLVY